MFTKPQFVTIASMQDAQQNLLVGPDWREQNLPLDSAILAEASEALEHFGWFWWKPTTPNIEQAFIELVDILHFSMSAFLVQYNNTYEDLYDGLSGDLASMTPDQHDHCIGWRFPEFVKEIVMQTLMSNHGFSLYLITLAAGTIGKTTDDLFNAYVGKNVLNAFRKENGYKEGTYIKIWNGVEDNEYLTKILKENALAGKVATPEELKSRLADIYKDIK